MILTKKIIADCLCNAFYGVLLNRSVILQSLHNPLCARDLYLFCVMLHTLLGLAMAHPHIKGV